MQILSSEILNKFGNNSDIILILTESWLFSLTKYVAIIVCIHGCIKQNMQNLMSR